jgi:hypothetical protein
VLWMPIPPRLVGGPRAASILRTPPGSEGSKGQHALAGARGPLSCTARHEARGADRNVSQDAQGGEAAELEQLRERMAVIKQEAIDEVDRKWGSPFRSQQLFDLKVQARLAGNDEYRSLQDRVQEAEAKLAAE